MQKARLGLAFMDYIELEWIESNSLLAEGAGFEPALGY